jgi:hypothetical protein
MGRILLNVLEKDALPFDVDYDIRQSAYLIALQVSVSLKHHLVSPLTCVYVTGTFVLLLDVEVKRYRICNLQNLCSF